MKKIILLMILLTPIHLKAAELIKVGAYNFQELLVKMAEEPKIRENFPYALKENLFLPLMLQSSVANIPSKKSSFTKQVDDYADLFITKALLARVEKQTESYKKSNDIKDAVVLGVTLAQRFRGFSIILKTHDMVLYSDTDLSKNIANTIAEYEDVKKQTIAEEKIIDEQSTGEI